MKERGKPPARNTMHQEIVCLCQVRKTAVRHGRLQYLPDLSEPYRTSGKTSHRAWFSPEEYRTLYTATRQRAREAKHARYAVFQMAEAALPRGVFAGVLDMINGLRGPPAEATSS